MVRFRQKELRGGLHIDVRFRVAAAKGLGDALLIVVEIHNGRSVLPIARIRRVHSAPQFQNVLVADDGWIVFDQERLRVVLDVLVAVVVCDMYQLRKDEDNDSKYK